MVTVSIVGIIEVWDKQPRGLTIEPEMLGERQMQKTPQMDSYLQDIRWERCPEHISEGLKNYILNNISTGGFLHAVLVNDLFGAFGRADEINKEQMHQIIQFLHNEVPAVCFGTQEKYIAWLSRRK